MSLRRVDDDGGGALGSSVSSIDAAIGALADRLPVATRLNHVLAIGAKFQLEQQGKQQQRELVKTDAYHRDRLGSFHVRGSYTYRGIVTSYGLTNYHIAVAAWKQTPENTNAQTAAVRATQELANVATSLGDLDFLRQEDAYVCLLYIFNTTAPGTQRNEDAKFMLQESLYHDKAEREYSHNKTRTLAREECTMANKYLGNPFIFDPNNTLTAYNGVGQNAATKQMEIDRRLQPKKARQRENASQMQLNQQQRVEEEQRRAQYAWDAQQPSFLRGNVSAKDKYDSNSNARG